MSLFIDVAARQVFVNGEERHLTPTGYELLLLIRAFRGYGISRKDMIEELYLCTPSSLHEHINLLRKALKPLEVITHERKKGQEGRYYWRYTAEEGLGDREGEDAG